MLIAAPFPVKGHSTARACTSLFCAAKEQKCAILWLEGQQHSFDVMWRVSFATVCRRGRFRERGSDGWRNPTFVWGLKWFGRQQLLDPLPSQESDKLLIQLLHAHFYNTEFHSSEPMQDLSCSTEHWFHLKITSGSSGSLTCIALNHILDVAV